MHFQDSQNNSYRYVVIKLIFNSKALDYQGKLAI